MEDVLTSVKWKYHYPYFTQCSSNFILYGVEKNRVFIRISGSAVQRTSADRVIMNIQMIVLIFHVMRQWNRSLQIRFTKCNLIKEFLQNVIIYKYDWCWTENSRGNHHFKCFADFLEKFENRGSHPSDDLHLVSIFILLFFILEDIVPETVKNGVFHFLSWFLIFQLWVLWSTSINVKDVQRMREFNWWIFLEIQFLCVSVFFHG